MDLGRGRGGDLGFLGGGRARGTPDVRARAVGTSEGVETVFRDGCDRSDSCAMTDERAFVRVFSRDVDVPQGFDGGDRRARRVSSADRRAARDGDVRRGGCV